MSKSEKVYEINIPQPPDSNLTPSFEDLREVFDEIEATKTEVAKPLPTRRERRTEERARAKRIMRGERR